LQNKRPSGHNSGMNTNNEKPEPPMDVAEHFCPNANCPTSGLKGQGNLRVHAKKEGRLRCTVCRKTFTITKLTPFYGLKTHSALVTIVVTLLAWGCPVQAIVRAYGLDERTIASWLDRAGLHSQQVHQKLVVQGNLDLQHVQAAEIYVKGHKFRAWMAMAIMVSTRLWLGGVIEQKRERALADELMQIVVKCCHVFAIVLVAVDGWKAYPKALKKAFRTSLPQPNGKRGRPRKVVWPGLMIAQVIKRKLKGRLVEVERRVLVGRGEEVEVQIGASGGGYSINTSYIERLNATFRQRLAVLARRTRNAAHKLERVERAMWLVGTIYNFCQPHHSLRRPNWQREGGKWVELSPAMASGLTNYIWSIEQLLWYKLTPPPYAPPKKRGRPPKSKS
jgi:transposase-like protein/IS1 family transposase